jgi:hypothetical protein
MCEDRFGMFSDGLDMSYVYIDADRMTDGWCDRVQTSEASLGDPLVLLKDTHTAKLTRKRRLHGMKRHCMSIC